jgi:hypothetical protein
MSLKPPVEVGSDTDPSDSRAPQAPLAPAERKGAQVCTFEVV